MSNTRIPLMEPCLSGREEEYVRDCIVTRWISSAGAYVDRFEGMVARAAGKPYGVATSSGTAALHLSLLVAGVRPDDEVLVSDLTFVAPVNAIRYMGAWPVLVDAEPLYWQMDVSRIAHFLDKDCERTSNGIVNRRSGRRVSAIVPVHVLGHPVDMAPLLELAERYGLVVIEDATESLGATYDGRPLGGLGTLGCFSFNGNKLLSTGGGGMIVTSDPHLAERARYFSTQAKDDPIRYIHEEIGFNYRLSNLHAAVGVAQMEQFEPFLARKRIIAERYRDGLAGIKGIEVPRASQRASSNWWLYTILVKPDEFGHTNMELLEFLAKTGIQTRPLWQPVHLNRPYRETQVLGAGVADSIYAQALSIPSSVDLTEQDQDRVIGAIRACAR